MEFLFGEANRSPRNNLFLTRIRPSDTLSDMIKRLDQILIGCVLGLAIFFELIIPLNLVDFGEAKIFHLPLEIALLFLAMLIVPICTIILYLTRFRHYARRMDQIESFKLRQKTKL